MSFPDGDWPLGSEVPGYQPAFGIGRQQTSVAFEEMYSMNLVGMTSENKRRLKRRQGFRRHVLGFS